MSSSPNEILQNHVNKLVKAGVIIDVVDVTKEVTSINTYKNKKYADEGIIIEEMYRNPDYKGTLRYKCTLCKEERLTEDNVMSHRVKQQHRINVENINMDELVKFMTDLPQALKEDEDEMLYIVQGIESEFRCRACKCELPTMHYVNDHLTSDGHKKRIDW